MGDPAVAEGRKRYYRSHREGTATSRCHGRLCRADFSALFADLVAYSGIGLFFAAMVHGPADAMFNQQYCRLLRGSGSREPRIASVDRTG